jgi:hypothetical protein
VADFISIYNADTVSATVTIKLDANGTEYELFKAVIGTGERIEYQDGVGFRVMNNLGSQKTSFNEGSHATGSSISTVVLSGDVVNNNAVANTIADVTGLSFAVTAAKTYWFMFYIWFTSNATTTGSRWSVNGPSSPTFLQYSSEYTLTATTTTRNANLGPAYDLPAASNATSGAIAQNIAQVEGLYRPTSNGTFVARFASEVAGAAITAKAGSVVYYQQLD